MWRWRDSDSNRWGTTAQERIGKPRVADLDFRLRIEINEKHAHLSAGGIENHVDPTPDRRHPHEKRGIRTDDVGGH